MKKKATLNQIINFTADAPKPHTEFAQGYCKALSDINGIIFDSKLPQKEEEKESLNSFHVSPFLDNVDSDVSKQRNQTFDNEYLISQLLADAIEDCLIIKYTLNAHQFEKPVVQLNKTKLKVHLGFSELLNQFNLTK